MSLQTSFRLLLIAYWINKFSLSYLFSRMGPLSVEGERYFSKTMVFNAIDEKKLSADDERQRELMELAAPLLDLKFIKKVLSDWQRPLPSGFLMRPLVLTGPSGVGKGRLVKALLSDYSRFFQKVVTHTTRLPRRSELNGTSYHFVDLDLFHTLNSTPSYFVETAEVHGNFYGMSRDAWQNIVQNKKISIMEIDIQGAKSIKALEATLAIKPVYVFVAPPNIDVLESRLRDRASETEEQIKLRLHNAKAEMEEAEASKIFQYFLVNEEITNTTNTFFRLVRDNYVTIPSASQIRKLQRAVRNLKMKALEGLSTDTDVMTEDLME